MTSSRDDPTTDHGLLTPVVAGTPVARLTGDRALLEAMVEVESALAAALADTGLVPRERANAVVEVCAKADLDVDDLALRATESGNPVVPLVTDLRARVAAVDPEAVGLVHRGATSQDVVDTALMLVSGHTLDLLAADLRTGGRCAARLADAHRRTLACGRTLTQQAMPTTFGFRAAGWLAGLTDALDRVQSVTARLPVQLGGSVGTAQEYGPDGPAVLDALAGRLGLVAPALAWHTRRTPVVDLGHALVTSSGAVGKIAADVLVMAQTEIGEVCEATGGSSSSMPHKSNPAQSVLVSAAARQVPALVSVLGTSMAAEQERPAGAWHAEWEPLRQALRLSGAAAHRCAAMLEGLQVDAAAMQRNLDTLAAAAGIDSQTLAATSDAVGPWIDRALTDYRRGLRE